MAGSSSSQSSGITGGDLSDFVEQEEISNMEFSEKEPMPIEWTDEKHSLYLKSIENSFVQQLYRSMDSIRLHSHIQQSSHARSSKYHQSHAADKFKVYQHGCWQKLKYGSGEPPPQKAGECHLLLQNPWIQHFSSRGHEIMQDNASFGTQPVSCGGRDMYTHTLANISDSIPIYQTIGDSSIGEEFSDQNFGEEDNEEVTCSLRAMKRMKTVDAVAQNHE